MEAENTHNIPIIQISTLILYGIVILQVVSAFTLKMSNGNVNEPKATGQKGACQI
jgi:hypothetical protein